MSPRPKVIELGPGADVEAFVASLSLVLPPNSVSVAIVLHDDGCPCLAGRPMAACTCASVNVELRDAPR